MTTSYVPPSVAKAKISAVLFQLSNATELLNEDDFVKIACSETTNGAKIREELDFLKHALDVIYGRLIGLQINE